MFDESSFDSIWQVICRPREEEEEENDETIEKELIGIINFFCFKNSPWLTNGKIKKNENESLFFCKMIIFNYLLLLTDGLEKSRHCFSFDI